MLKMVGFHSWVVGAVFDGVSLKKKYIFFIKFGKQKKSTK